MKKTILALAALFVIAAPAAAIEVNTGLVIKDPDGKPYQDCAKVDAQQKCEALVDMTIGRAILMAVNVAEPNMAPADVIKRGMLARRVSGAIGKVDLTSEEVEMIKAAVMKRGFQPYAAIGIIEIIDPENLKR